MSFKAFIQKFTGSCKGIENHCHSRDEDVNILDLPDVPETLRNSLRASVLEELIPMNSQNFAEDSIPVESEDDGDFSDAKSETDVTEESFDYRDHQSNSIYRASSMFSLDQSHFSANFPKTNLRSVSNVSQFDHSSPIVITKIMPVRHNGVIIHWKMQNMIGVRGYKVLVDGQISSSVHSADRTSAFVDNIEMNAPHQFAIKAIQDDEWWDEGFATQQDLTAIYNYSPLINEFGML